jgi:hypothetical protein
VTNCASCTSTIQPRPIYNGMASSADTVIQTTLIALGGFNGLNN